VGIPKRRDEAWPTGTMGIALGAKGVPLGNGMFAWSEVADPTPGDPARVRAGRVGPVQGVSGNLDPADAAHLTGAP
jgi:hypothetical protein